MDIVGITSSIGLHFIFLVTIRLTVCLCFFMQIIPIKIYGQINEGLKKTF